MFDQKQAVKLHGDRFGMLSLINRDEDDGFVSGVITTFIKVEFDGRWFDASVMDDASAERVAEVVIPDDIYPNAARFYFEFDVQKHRIYVQSYSEGKYLSAKQAHALFSGLAELRQMKAKFGKIHVTIVQSKEGLDKLFSIKIIKEIKITIYKPNPDIFSENFEANIENHLAQAHSQSVTISYQADPGESVRPTAEIMQISQAALENGNVQVRGRDEAGAVNKSTDKIPKEYHDKYDSDQVTERNAFRRLIPRWIHI